MNLRYFLLTILVLLITTSIVLIFFSKNKLNHKKQVTEQLAIIPKIPGVPIGSNNNTNWEYTRKSTIIQFFNSECHHCQNEATAIFNKLEAFKNVNLLFVSEEVESNILAFSIEYKLDNQPNIWWLKMKPKDVYNTFGNIGVPHFWVYNKEGNLVKEFRGETKVEALLEWL